MDIYGIGAAMKSMVHMYFISARASGRTTTLLNSLKDGDRVYFFDNRDAEIMSLECRRRNLRVACVTIPVTNPRAVFHSPPSEGRSVFDHRWVEEYYRLMIEITANDIDHFQKQSSGFGEAHEETRLQAKEISRWSTFL